MIYNYNLEVINVKMKDNLTRIILGVLVVVSLFLSYKVYTLDRAVNAKWQYAQENRQGIENIISFLNNLIANQK